MNLQIPPPSSRTGLLTPPPDDDQCPLNHHILPFSCPSSPMGLRFRASTAARRDSLDLPVPSQIAPLPLSDDSESSDLDTPFEPNFPFPESDALPTPTPSGSAPPRPSPSLTSSHAHTHSNAFLLWRQARQTPAATTLPAGAHRPLTFENFKLAIQILRESTVSLFFLLWTIHPFRILVFLALNFVRGLFPAARSYSQALLLDEVHLAVSSHVISPRVLRLLSLEILRMAIESLFEHFATSNEQAVQQTIRFRVEYVQMETRLRLDIPSLSSPAVQDLLAEAELFARSFNGVGGALGLLSPFDLVRSVTTLVTEIAGQSYVLYTLMGEGKGLTATQGLLVASALTPYAMAILNWAWNRLTADGAWGADGWSQEGWPYPLYNAEEAETAERHERMRRLAYDESFKSEIMLFGLGKWILKTWVETREALLKADSDRQPDGHPRRSILGFNVSILTNFTKETLRELNMTFQAVPLIVQLSTASLGSVTLWRTSIQTLLSSVQTLARTFNLTYQSIFLMGAFHAALTLQPSMEPNPKKRIPFEPMTNDDGRRTGMKLETRNLWFTYPNESEPVIRGLDLKVEPGEVVAIVGKNGSGKSTLMHLLLRLFDYDHHTPIEDPDHPSEFLINDQPAELFSPVDLHAHSSAVFQNFSKLTNATVRENAGIGAFEDMEDPDEGNTSVQSALRAGGAWEFVKTLRHGMDTRLEAGGFGGGSGVGGRGLMGRGRSPTPDRHQPHKVSLSGGQWQRIALSRSFMRTSSSSLLMLDEASSQLDAHAQNEVFRRILAPEERGKRTVIFITHRLSTVKWADKIAFFDEGKVKEFGTHQDLMDLEGGGYRELFNAFVNSTSGVLAGVDPRRASAGF